MRNYLADINNFGINVPNDVNGGDIFLVGNLPLVSPTTAKSGERVAAFSLGIFNFKIVGNYIQGMPIYFHKNNKQIDSTSSADAIQIGFSLETGANSVSRVLFIPVMKGDKGDKGGA